MSKHYVIALVTLLLSVLVAFGWALAVFYGGISIISSEVWWHDVTRMLLFCLASFSLFRIATFLPVRGSMGVRLGLCFGLVFLGGWREVLTTLIINRWPLVLWLEVVGLCGGSRAAGWWLYDWGPQDRLTRLVLQ